MIKHEAHTPEPWIFEAPDADHEGIIIGRRGGAVVDGDFTEANARRIVACVNACAGIETYALELMTGELSILNQISATTPEKLTPKATQYRQQRDKLLAVLVDLVNQPQDITTPAYQSALAVIQECEK